MNYLLNQHKSGGVLYDSEFMQVLSTGERCSPLQIIRERFYCRKIATLFAGAFMIIEKAVRVLFLDTALIII